MMEQRSGKRIFVGEAEEWQGKPLYRAIVEQIQRAGAAGTTVTRGIEGFGPRQRLATERIPDIADNLPLQIEIVDSAERVEQGEELLDAMVQRGTITVTPVQILIGGEAS